MGDGTFDKRDKTLRLCTGLFTAQMASTLYKVLNAKYKSLGCTYSVTAASESKGRSETTTLYVPSIGLGLLRPYVQPHIIPSMLYRIGVCTNNLTPRLGRCKLICIEQTQRRVG